MRVDPEAAILHKCRELIMQLNVNLNHFPRHEKHGLYTYSKALRRGDIDSVISCIGHAKASGTHKHFMNRLREYPALYDQLPDTMKRGQP